MRSFQLIAAFLIVNAAARSPLLQAAKDGAGSVVKMTKAGKSSETTKTFTIPIQKQIVPVRKNNVTVSYKSVYFGNVKLGTAPHDQEFSVIFDTASGQVIVPSSQCQSPACLVHRRYDRTKSPSAQDINVDGSLVEPGTERDEVTVGFGTGEVTGEFVRETVCLGSEGALGAGGEARCAKALNVVSAVEMSDDPFRSFSFDGVLGLGLRGLSLDGEFSFFGNMAAQRKINKPQFAVFLASEDEVSEISFGGHNPKKLRSALNWANVALPELGYWQVKIKEVRVGGKTLSMCSTGNCRAVVDTGSSHLGVPGGMLEDLKKSLSTIHTGNNTNGIDCRNAVGPVLEIDLGGFSLSLRTEDYAKQKPFLASSKKSKSSEMACRPNLMRVGLPEPMGPNLFILGEPVLRRYYTVFDWDKKKIGFGEAAHDEEQAEIVMLIQFSAVVRRS